MARRQLQIAGTERTQHPEIEEAAEAWREARQDEHSAHEKQKQKRFELIALMQARKVTRYKYNEPATNEEILVTLDDEPKIRAKKTGEAEPEIGEGISSGEDVTPKAGLMAQAAAAMADSNVEENAEGDVVVPDAAKPKSKKKAKR